MKKILSAFTIFTLICSAMAVPFAAAGDAPTVKYATPTIDGILDKEYKESFHLEHRWTKEKDNDKIWKAGKYSDQFEGVEHEEYTWDCSADSYFLCDDYALYIAVDVTDNDFGCVEDVISIGSSTITADLYGSEFPFEQDGINIRLDCKKLTASIYVDRRGKVMLQQENSELTDLNYYIDGTELRNTELGHCAVTETATGYTVEMRIPLKQDAKSEIIRENAPINYCITVFDAPSDSPYHWGDYVELTNPYWLRDFVGLSDGFTENGLPGDIRFTLGLKLIYGDITGDGVFNVRDLARLMKYISGEKVDVYNPDLNGDGNVNSKDLVCLMKFLAAGHNI